MQQEAVLASVVASPVPTPERGAAAGGRGGCAGGGGCCAHGRAGACLAHAARGAVKAFVVTYGVKAALSLVMLAVSGRATAPAAARSLTSQDTLRFGGFLGALVAGQALTHCGARAPR